MSGWPRPAGDPVARDVRPADAPPVADHDDTMCPRCGEGRDLAKVKGCIRCLACGFKFDCNGW